VGVSTLRAWEARFNFLDPQRSPAGHRVYDEADVERVNAVLRLLGEGLTLAAAIARVANVGPQGLPEGEAEALLYAQILRAAEQGVWVARDGRTRYANRRMAEIMGYSVDELIGIPVLDFFEPEELPIVRKRTALVRAGQKVHFTQRLRRADGSVFLAEINTTPLVNQAGLYEGAVALVADVTARNEAEMQARVRSTILDSIGEAVTAQTLDGTVVYVNAAAERLFGWQATDVIGRQSRDVFPAPDEPTLGRRIHALLHRGRRFSGRYRMRRHDGSQFVAHLTSAPAFDAKGDLVGFVAVISDGTERDQREREMETRVRQAEALALLGGQVLRDASNPSGATPLLTEAVEVTRRLLQADHVSLLDVLADSNELRLRVASPENNARIEVPSGNRSFAGYTALTRKVVVVENIEYDPRFDGSLLQPDTPTQSAIGAPVFGPDGVTAVLIAESATPSTFHDGDTHFIQNMANIIGNVLLTRSPQTTD
jgi:PAS domain S-box-containing protein